MGSNLPDGVNDIDIPGNRKCDIEPESAPFHELTEKETEQVHDVSPGLAMLSALAKGCAKAMALEPTYASLLLAQLSTGIENLPAKYFSPRTFKREDMNWTASGCEAVFTDEENGQKYHVTVEPIKEGQV